MDDEIEKQAMGKTKNVSLKNLGVINCKLRELFLTSTACTYLGELGMRESFSPYHKYLDIRLTCHYKTFADDDPVETDAVVWALWDRSCGIKFNRKQNKKAPLVTRLL